MGSDSYSQLEAETRAFVTPLVSSDLRFSKTSTSIWDLLGTAVDTTNGLQSSYPRRTASGNRSFSNTDTKKTCIEALKK